MKIDLLVNSTNQAPKGPHHTITKMITKNKQLSQC